MSELAFRPLDLDVAGVFTRRPEAYHGLVKDRLGVADITGTKTIHSSPTVKEDGLQKLLDYDPWRRASLLEGFFPPGDPPDPLNPWAEARLALGERSHRSPQFVYRANRGRFEPGCDCSWRPYLRLW